MKKSAHVPAVLIIALAAGLEMGCSSRRDCVDVAGRTVADSYCTSGAAGYHWITRSTSRSGFGTTGRSSTTGGSIGS